MTFWEELKSELVNQTTSEVTIEGRTLTLGLRDSTGRQIPLVIGTTVTNDMFRISDGGESWSELVQGGFADQAPSAGDSEKITRLCRSYDVNWDAYGCEIHAVGWTRNIFDVASRITAASIALEGWKAWYPATSQIRVPTSVALAERISKRAPRKGWSVSMAAKIQGRKHLWPVSASLSRRNKEVAVTVTGEKTPERLIERLIGWHYDTSKPIVAIVEDRVEQELRDNKELTDVRLVSRRHRNVVDKVLESAEYV